jgi:hypothetical protein
MLLARACSIVIVLAGFAGADNLILNGNFSLGNTDFSSAYSDVPANGTVFTAPGDYGLTTNPSTGFTNGYQSYTDHTGDLAGLMLLVDGLGAGSNVWSEGGINLVSGTTYTFSGYVADADVSAFSGNPPILDFFVNGSMIGSSYTVPNAPGDWDLWTFTYKPTSSASVTLSIQDVNTTPDVAGNDFSLDDLCLTSSSCASSTSAVPEPSGAVVCLLGLLGLCVFRATTQRAGR